MFIFFHNDQLPDNINYYKGILFENLLRDFLIHRGYEVNFNRIKKNSLEYDIEGKDKTTHSEIIGEAKALTDSISGKIFTSFLGKLMIVRLDNKKVRGLFLSTSSLTPEANENYLKVKDEYEIIALTGKELFKNIREEFNLIPSSNLKTRLKQQYYNIQNEYLLITDNGKFLMLVCSSPNSVVPSYFLLIDQDGIEITDNNFISRLKGNIKLLSTLTYIETKERNQFLSDRIINKGLQVGESWIDYRRPAAPQYFIGRENICKDIIQHIENNFNENVIQIKSRSGVGKSSLLSFLELSLSRNNIHTELHDALNIKSVLDIFVIVQRFTGSKCLPNDFEDVENQISTLFEDSNINRAVIMVDQFESTFNNQDVFNAYENLINIISNYREKIFVIIARKSDQLTTYDDSKISLNKINSLSTSLELVDFNKPEAKALIENINEESNNKISSDVKSYVLGFASGFPWLLKRTMAHIVKMTNMGYTQKELLERSLKLEDLFNEELRELDELEKGYLKRIAEILPATINELHHKFSEDSLLKKVLDKLTAAKLLRLTGETYDTYNDVFKEYLKTGKINEYNPPIIYRNSPNSVLRLFYELIISRKPVFPIEDIQELSRRTKGSSFNLIKELCNLNLLVSVEKYWEIPESVKESYKEKRLGEYLRNQLIENDLVIKLKNHLEKKINITIQTLPLFLSEQFPFQEIEPNEKTWMTYSNCLINWLELTKIIIIGQNDELLLPSDEIEKITEDLGNLTDISSTWRRYKTDDFLPTTSFNNVEKCFLLLHHDITQIRNADKKSMADFKNGGWVVNNTLSVNNLIEFKKQVIERITTENHNKIWEAARKEEFLSKVFKETFGESYSDETNRFLLIKLINWGKSLGLIPFKRYKYIERKQKSERIKIYKSRNKKNTSPPKLKIKKKLLSDIIWETHYKELEKYITISKDSCVPRNGETKKLGYWVSGLRMKRKRKQLSEEKIDLLNQINFDWDPVKNVWDKRYRDLLKFKEEYGYIHVPKEIDEKLHFWVKNQRMNIYKGKISDEKKELLLKVGILDKYTPAQKALIPFDTLNLLKEYYSKHGDINVPQLDKEYKNLGRWINDQRVMRKRGKLRKDREKILDGMGIVWDTKDNNWEKKLNVLNKFHKKYGHFNVTRRDTDFPGLGKWIYDLKKSKKLSEERIKKLLEIGFNWEKEKIK